MARAGLSVPVKKQLRRVLNGCHVTLQLQKNQSQGSVDTSSGLGGKGNHRKPREETSAMIWVARAGALIRVGASGHVVV